MATKGKPRLIVTTTVAVDGYEVTEYLGIVRGIVVRTPSIGQGLRGAFQSVLGGSVEAYEEVCEEARAEAFTKMTHHALKLGADAVLGMAYDATEFAESTTEVLAYGTAVKLRKKSGT